MSTVKSKKLQVGTDATSSNNFTIYQPAVPDGTLRIGVGNADNPTEVARFDSIPSYSARAWVNFNGTGTVAIRASGNVSSITDHATGRYTVTFTTAMPDTNYSVAGSVIGTDDRGASNFGTNAPGCDATGTNTYTTTAVRFCIINNPDTAYVDCDRVSIQIFR